MALPVRFIRWVRCGIFLLLCLFSTAGFAEESWQLNFRDADINDVIRFVAEATDKTMIVDPGVKGRIKLISERSVDREELYALFQSILEAHGFTAIAVGGGDVVRVVPTRDAKHVASLIAPDTVNIPSGFSTKLVPLHGMDGGQLLPALRSLISPEGFLVTAEAGNALIVTDYPGNIDKVEGLLEQLEARTPQKTETFALEYTSAAEVVRMLEKMPWAQEMKNGQGTPWVADPRTNTIYVTAVPSKLRQVRAFIQRLDAPVDTHGGARVMYLEYAKAADVAEVLRKVAETVVPTDNRSQQAINIEADEATNSLIITGGAESVQALDAIIRKLDIRRAQVLIETIIVEIQGTDEDALGIEWLFENQDDVFGSSSDGDGLLSAVAEVGLDPGSTPADTAGVIANTLGDVWGVAKVRPDSTSFVALVNALRDNKQANILSTPTLLTLDNNEATISVGQEVPFLTGRYTTSTGDASNPFQTIQRETVGLTLTVTPQVNEGDAIVLDLTQEISSLTGLEAADIITNERKIASTVLAKDRQVIVLGGLIKDDVQEQIRKVWLLGDIPWLGRLFRSEKSSVVKTNLLVFLRPTIIRSDAVLDGATAEKYRYIRQRQLEAGSLGAAPEEALPVLPEWQAPSGESSADSSTDNIR